MKHSEEDIRKSTILLSIIFGLFWIIINLVIYFGPYADGIKSVVWFAAIINILFILLEWLLLSSINLHHKPIRFLKNRWRRLLVLVGIFSMGYIIIQQIIS